MSGFYVKISTFNAGYEHEQVYNELHFDPVKYYEISHIEIGQSMTRIYLVNGENINSVFVDVYDSDFNKLEDGPFDVRVSHITRNLYIKFGEVMKQK